MNQDIIQAQKSVLAKPISAEFGLSRTGNDQVAIQFELLEGEDKGRQITAYLYFTKESNTERSVQAPQNCGCSFRSGDIFDLEGFGSKNVRLTIVHENFDGRTRAKVRWINADKPFAGDTMNANQKEAFRSRMRGFIVKPESDDLGDLPF